MGITTQLRKALTGIEGLDEITHGGLPEGRTTLVAGSAGSGKTVLALQFLLNGAVLYGEPGVLISFEESESDLAKNIASFGYDLEALERDGLIAVDYVELAPHAVVEAGAYDLEGLFVRLAEAVDRVGAKRVVLDTVEVLFSALTDQAQVRGEMLRLFRWLKTRGLTAIITGERGGGSITRHGLEEYVADCVLLLDHRVADQISTRRLRIVKYRGSLHEMDEHPFLMGPSGISVLPITSADLDHQVSNDRISSGVPELDEMLGGKGFYRGSSILLSGTAGVGKSSLALTLLQASCRRGERALYFGFEESVSQSIRNMKSIGMDLAQWIDRDLLRLAAARPSSLGLEAHLATINEMIRQFEPRMVVLDPISSFISLGEQSPVKSMLTRLVDTLKSRQITGFFTHLTGAGENLEAADERVSSVMDTWMMLRDVERRGSRSSEFAVLKSRGMRHSRDLVTFALTDDGIQFGRIHQQPTELS